jgi:hypothetical protein
MTRDARLSCRYMRLVGKSHSNSSVQNSEFLQTGEARAAIVRTAASSDLKYVAAVDAWGFVCVWDSRSTVSSVRKSVNDVVVKIIQLNAFRRKRAASVAQIRNHTSHVTHHTHHTSHITHHTSHITRHKCPGFRCSGSRAQRVYARRGSCQVESLRGTGFRHSVYKAQRQDMHLTSAAARRASYCERSITFCPRFCQRG